MNKKYKKIIEIINEVYKKGIPIEHTKMFYCPLCERFVFVDKRRDGDFEKHISDNHFPLHQNINN